MKRLRLSLLALALGAAAIALLVVPRPDARAPRDALPIARLLGELEDDARYAHADRVREFDFPADHGAHTGFRSEWWYFTGNLRTRAGRRYGYQLTFFRFALSPRSVDASASAWRSQHVYMAHFALTDIDAGHFHSFERSSRAALGLAGAQAEPFAVWVDDWSARSPRNAFAPRLRARSGRIGIDLQLEQGKPIVLQGERGLSRKGKRAGNASYYYSLTRMPTSGVITIDDEAIDVGGTSWMDREWSTSTLEADQIGWDWFALQLNDGRELMFYRLRRRDGRIDPHSAGVIVDLHGNASPLQHSDVSVDATEYWESPTSSATYPARWHLALAEVQLALDVTPVLNNQEHVQSFRYWEGAVNVTGRQRGRPLRGVGYVELVGY